MEELKQCRLQQRNISATVDKLTLCLPGEEPRLLFICSAVDLNARLFALCFCLNTSVGFFFVSLSSSGDVQQTARANEIEKVNFA